MNDSTRRLSPQDLEELFTVLRTAGFRLVGPKLRDQAIVYDELESLQDLPRGWTDDQEKGQYRLRRRDDGAYFGYNVGPHSWKQFLFPAKERLWRAKRTPNGFESIPENETPIKTAFIGARSCDLHAIAVQDKVFLEGKYADPRYQARRENIFVVAVQCTQAANTCFCVSMNTGPKATLGYDLALTEVVNSNEHYFLLEVGTDAGAKVASQLKTETASSPEQAKAAFLIERTAQSMGRKLDTTDIKELLYANLEHPRWDDVATRCLSCTNCTLVCPTCFCSSVEDITDLTGENTERVRRWDSCFTLDHSSIHGGVIRYSTKSRYRQWLTHKVASWIDQFGTSGCVGCGRCIVWCPVGIDLTEEISAIRGNSK